jgi:hypothetical protein
LVPGVPTQNITNATSAVTWTENMQIVATKLTSSALGLTRHAA